MLRVVLEATDSLEETQLGPNKTTETCFAHSESLLTLSSTSENHFKMLFSPQPPSFPLVVRFLVVRRRHEDRRPPVSSGICR